MAMPGKSTSDFSETPPTNSTSTRSRGTPARIVSPTESIQEHPPLLSQTLPSWAREVGAALAVRPSRASSIVSTRTRFSTTTVQDDARSVDIQLGSQHFRINRDGSRITSEAPPPPYSGPGEAQFIPEDERQTAVGGTNGRPRHRSSVSLHVTPARGLTRLMTGLRANILDPSEVDIPSPVEASQSSPKHQPGTHATTAVDEGDLSIGDVPSRNRSYKSGEETITVTDAGRQRRTVSQNDLPDLSTPLRRRNGVRLPALRTESPHSRLKDKHSPISAMIKPSSSSLRQQHSQSAGPVLSEQEDHEAPRSPTFIGRHATGIFPMHRRGPTQSISEEPSKVIGHTAGGTNTVGDLVDDSHGQDSDEENNISLHYTRMIRFIDRDHRRALHAKDKELAELRERLSEVDTVYRLELKSRDFIIDDLKLRLAHMEENRDAVLERARNEVEDIWERRWKDQEFHLKERMRRIEADAQANIDRILVEHNAGEAVLAAPANE